LVNIHPTAIVDPAAKIGDGVYIGPFCTVGPNVTIGEGTWIQSHVVLTGIADIGKNNKIYAFACLGIDPQDKKYAGEPTRLVVGDNNVIREHCTLATGTIQDEGLTSIGNGNLFMANTHIAHDCRIGNGTIMANNAGLAGHVVVEDDVIIGGIAGIHQFVRIGKGAMLSGGTMLRQDVMPFIYVAENPGRAFGVNLEGMKRHGYSKETIKAVREVYRIVFRENNTVPEAVEKINAFIEGIDEQSASCCILMRDFLASSKRGITRER